MFEPLPPPSKRPAVQVAVDAYLAHRIRADSEQIDVPAGQNDDFADGMDHMTSQLLEDLQ